jgi:hypothetical protein
VTPETNSGKRDKNKTSKISLSDKLNIEIKTSGNETITKSALNNP